MSLDSLLTSFFGEGNELSLSGKPVASWTAGMTDAWPDVPLILPRVRKDQPGQVWWYVITQSALHARRVKDELGAWIGPTYSRNWTGQARELDKGDPVESAILDFAAGPTYVVVVAESERERARDRFGQLTALWRERPERTDEIKRRASVLIRDFNLALASGNSQTAREVLQELVGRGLLTAENQLFLEVALMASEGQWRALVNHPRLKDLAARSRPWPVTRALITALYRTYLANAETAEGLGSLIERATELEADLPELFRTRGPIDTPDVAKTFALIDAAHPERPRRTRARVLEAPGLSEADLAFLRDVLEVGESPEAVVDPLDDARTLLARGEVDAAWDLALEGPVGGDRAVLLVQCAAEVGTLEAAGAATAAFDGLPKSAQRDLTDLSKRFQRDLNDVRAVVLTPDRERSPRHGSWIDWFDVLHAREEWPEGMAIAEKGAREWCGQLSDSKDLESLIAAITSTRSAEQQRLFLGALPFLLDWLDRVDSIAQAAPIQRAALEAICLQELRSLAALDAALGLVEALLDFGVDDDEYATFLELLEVLWERSAVLAAAPWLADCLELLSDSPGDRAVLAESAARLIAPVHEFQARMSEEVAQQLLVAANAAGVTEAAHGLVEASGDSVITAEARDRLQGKLVGCYTLTPAVGQRVKDGLENLFPGLNVKINSDLVRTTALDHLAEAADVMIVMLRSAKHAATDAIDQARPASKLTLRLGCKGSSRVIAEFLHAVATTA